MRFGSSSEGGGFFSEGFSVSKTKRSSSKLLPVWKRFPAESNAILQPSKTNSSLPPTRLQYKTGALVFFVTLWRSDWRTDNLAKWKGEAERFKTRSGLALANSATGSRV